MKKLLPLILALMICVASVASAEVLSPRVPYVIRMTTVVGTTNENEVLFVSSTEDAALNAAEAHVNAVRGAKPERSIYGEEIVEKLKELKFFACAPIEVVGHTDTKDDVKCTLETPYALGVVVGEAVTLVVCVPTNDGYAYTTVEGMGVDENKCEFVMSADLVALLPDTGAIFDFFAK